MSEPIYEVTISGKMCAFFCPVCLVPHTHSTPEEPGVPEHRVAHCNSRGYHPQGYWIVRPEHPMNEPGTKAPTGGETGASPERTGDDR